MISTLLVPPERRKETLMEVGHKGRSGNRFILALGDCSEINSTVHKMGYVNKLDPKIISEMGVKFFYQDIVLNQPRFVNKEENMGIMFSRVNDLVLEVFGQYDRLMSIWFLCNLFQRGKIFCMNCRRPDDRCQLGLFLAFLRDVTRKKERGKVKNGEKDGK